MTLKITKSNQGKHRSDGGGKRSGHMEVHTKEGRLYTLIDSTRLFQRNIGPDMH